MTLQVVGWGVLAFVGLLVGYLAVVIFSPWIKEPRQPLPDVPRLTAGDGEAQVAAVPEAVQQEVRFTVAGEQLLGWLYMPPGATGPVPCVVMNTGFGGTRGAGSALTPFVSRFAQAGLAALTFDYRHFGASTTFWYRQRALWPSRSGWALSPRSRSIRLGTSTSTAESTSNAR